MSTLDIEAIKTRLAAATPGPWVSNWSQPSGDERCEQILAENGDEVVGALWYDGLHLAVNEKDADLIAHAPADIAALLAENARLRAVVVAATTLRNQAAEGETWEVLAEYARETNDDYMLRVSEAVRAFDAALLAAGMVPDDTKEEPMPHPL